MRLVFDIEADGWRDTATQVWCLCFADIGAAHTPYDEPRIFKFPPKDVVEWGLGALTEADELIGHNIIDYDLPLLERLYGWTPSPDTKITDTVILSRLLRSDRHLHRDCPGNVAPHSLKAWGYRVGRGKVEHDDWTQYSEAMLHRCAEDVEINVLTYEALLRERDSTGIDWTQAIRIEHDIARLILQQELNGVPMDLALVWSTRQRLVDKMAQVSAEVVPNIPEVALSKAKQGTWPVKQYKKDGTPTVNALRYYGQDFGKERKYRKDLIVKTAPVNLKSPVQVKDYLLTIGWKPTEWNYKKDLSGKPMRDPTGNKIRTSPKLTLDSLESCVWPNGESSTGSKIVEYLMMAHREGMLKGWLRDVRSDGKIEARALACGTPTGRMTHRQVVNVPRNSSLYGTELRSCFISEPGYTRVGIDLRSCQLRALCHYMEDEEYQRQVIEGKPHEYAAEMAGLIGDSKMSAKDKGKKFNYTVLFGGGDEKVAASLGMSVTQAKTVRRTFFKNLPALNALLKKLKRQWKDKGYLLGVDGRAIWVRSEHMLLVYLMQALESVVIKQFIINVSKGTCDVKLITTMHDEVQYLVRTEQVPWFSMQCESEIENVNEMFKLKCPQAIDINLGTTWAECH